MGFQRGFHSFLGLRAMIAQVHERGHEVVTQPIDRRGDRCRARHRRGVELLQPIAQLEDDPLGGLLADPGNRREPCDVTTFHRNHQLTRIDSRQHRDRQLWPDAADADQPLEHLLLEQREEPVQLERFLTHVRVHAQRNVRPDVAGIVERRQRHVQLVADALHVDDEAIRLFVDDATA
jgi:hypothetical protein